MKTKSFLKETIFWGVIFICGNQSFGAEKSEIEKDQKKAPVKKTTEVSFDDVLVQGKYHFSDEAVTTVEQDKVLNGLLSVRKDFNDRVKKAKERF